MKTNKFIILAGTLVHAYNANTGIIEDFVTSHDKIYPYKVIIDPKISNSYVRIALDIEPWTWMDVDIKDVFKITGLSPISTKDINEFYFTPENSAVYTFDNNDIISGTFVMVDEF